MLCGDDLIIITQNPQQAKSCKIYINMINHVNLSMLLPGTHVLLIIILITMLYMLYQYLILVKATCSIHSDTSCQTTFSIIIVLTCNF